VLKYPHSTFHAPALAARQTSHVTSGTTGYVAFVLPFFSDAYLPEESGPADALQGYRDHIVTPYTRDEATGRVARYFCVRLSSNGDYVRQVCDPATGDQKTTGVVRAAIEGLWNDLKRAHWLDWRTRFLHITITFKSNNNAVASRANLMFEITGSSSVLPSYDFETFVTDTKKLQETKIFMNVALGMLLFFVFLEFVEMHDTGLAGYFMDGWNIMDWINFTLLLAQYATLVKLFNLDDGTEGIDDCRSGSTVCEGVGYFDDWEYARTIKAAKLYLSFNVNIQLLKIVKFMNMLVPKTSLAVKVLGVAAADLVFFSSVFFISILAFSNMFFVQLGPVMEGYWSQAASIITLVRALFGDFDIDDILNNSNGYLNVILFLAYLFVALFIILSIFLTILGEAQAAVSQANEKLSNSEEGYKEYGVIEDIGSVLGKCRDRVMTKVKPSYALGQMHLQASDVQTIEIQTVDDVRRMMAGMLERQRNQLEEQQKQLEEISKANEQTLLKALTGLGLVAAVKERAGSTSATSTKCANAAGPPPGLGLPSRPAAAEPWAQQLPPPGAAPPGLGGAPSNSADGYRDDLYYVC